MNKIEKQFVKRMEKVAKFWAKSDAIQLKYRKVLVSTMNKKLDKQIMASIENEHTTPGT